MAASRRPARTTPPGEAPGNGKRLAEVEARGFTLVGDVHPDSVLPVAGALTPVPGGVGPLTIAMLMVNTVRAARLRRGQERRESQRGGAALVAPVR